MKKMNKALLTAIQQDVRGLLPHPKIDDVLEVLDRHGVPPVEPLVPDTVLDAVNELLHERGQQLCRTEVLSLRGTNIGTCLKLWSYRPPFTIRVIENDDLPDPRRIPIEYADDVGGGDL